MSTFAKELIHPVTGKKKMCICIDDYFGKHAYGYRFEGETIVYTEFEMQALPPPSPKSYPDD